MHSQSSNQGNKDNILMYIVWEDPNTVSLVVMWNQQVFESSNKMFSEMKYLM